MNQLKGKKVTKLQAFSSINMTVWNFLFFFFHKARLLRLFSPEKSMVVICNYNFGACFQMGSRY